ncbi:unnamed protein product [Cunninghamella echinulata]
MEIGNQICPLDDAPANLEKNENTKYSHHKYRKYIGQVKEDFYYLIYEKLYTLSEAAKELTIPESTARNRLKRDQENYQDIVQIK